MISIRITGRFECGSSATWLPEWMGLRARWIVDPTDHSGRRLIAVWSRLAAPISTPSTAPTDPPRLPIKRADDRADEEWPQAS